MRIDVISSENLIPKNPLIVEPDVNDEFIKFYFNEKLVATGRRNEHHLSYSSYTGLRERLINKWNKVANFFYKKAILKTGFHHLPWKLYIYDIKREI